MEKWVSVKKNGRKPTRGRWMKDEERNSGAAENAGTEEGRSLVFQSTKSSILNLVESFPSWWMVCRKGVFVLDTAPTNMLNCAGKHVQSNW